MGNPVHSETKTEEKKESLLTKIGKAIRSLFRR